MLGLIKRLISAILHVSPRKLLPYLPVAAILAIIPLASLAYFTSRSPIYCAKCHNKSHEPELWRQSNVHPQRVSCIECHAVSNSFILRNFSAQPARVNSNCLRCHKLSDVKKIGAPGYKFKKNADQINIPHELHVVKVGANCTDCHYNIVHDRRPHKTNRPPMEGCLSQCHRADAKNCKKCHPSGTVRPPISRTLDTESCKICHGEFLKKKLKFDGRDYRHARHIQNGILCGYCHSNAVKHGALLIKSQDCVRCHATKKPAMHGEDWLKRHGKRSIVERQLCATCHQQRLCDACHGIQMPHDSAWRAKHATTGVSQATVCARCHTRDACRSCHFSLSKSPHGARWKSSHGSTAKASQRSCANCHTKNFCVECHGTTMPHPTSWLTEHGQKAISDSGLCSSCHITGKKNDCANCHRTLKPQFHNAEFRKTHVKIAKQKPELCALCHSKNGCNNCHKTPMPHASDWAMTHRSHGADFKSGAFCYNCHKKEFCATCHDLKGQPN